MPTPPVVPERVDQDQEWLDLAHISRCTTTSEDPVNPVEDAFIPGIETGWSARQSGRQVLQVKFYEPQNLKRIRLVFKEDHFNRTQEFVLRWSRDGSVFQDIVRQQYNFSPRTIEVEEYEAKLESVEALQLTIIPDISGGAAIASLAELRVA